MNRFVKVLLPLAVGGLALVLGTRNAGAVASAADGDAGAGDFYLLENRMSGGYAEVRPEGIKQNGTWVQQWGLVADAPCQEWLVTPLKAVPGYYKIENRASGRVLSIDNNKIRENGALAVQWSYHGDVQNGHQHWKFERVGGAALIYKIINRASGKALSVDLNHIEEKGALLMQWDYHPGEPGNAHQQWSLRGR
jgi:hypothetical protein